MCDDDAAALVTSASAAPLSAAERAEARRQKILAKGTERMSKVSGLYTKSSCDALGSAHQDVSLQHSQSASSPLVSSDQEKSSNTATAVTSAAPSAEVQAALAVGGNADAAQQRQLAPDCELPSIRNPKLQFTPPPPVSSSPVLRAPGVSAFRPDSNLLAVAPSAPRPPLSPRFWWAVAVWMVAAAFCAGVYAHTLQLLPPAPYVLFLIVVIRRLNCAAAAPALSRRWRRPWPPSSLFRVSPFVRSLIRQTNPMRCSASAFAAASAIYECCACCFLMLGAFCRLVVFITT